MGSANANPAHDDAPDILEVAFGFDTDAANNPTLHTGDNRVIKSVTHTGTGEYTITLKESYQQLKSAVFTALFATAIDLVPQMKTQDPKTAKTIVVRLLAAAVPTDPPAVGTNAGTIYGVLKLRNTVVK